MYTAAQSDASLKQRLLAARQSSKYAVNHIPDALKPVVRSLIRKGESKKRICLFFQITYQQLKHELQ